ncbi:hypothetical protein L1987_00168 [Smallanthus sonchifolius]|uniref:Uncharacterized protein n=1 Tax=Smallanthus sonchifolius TaxID=185202 RepID=A0ACB9K1E4_9ASTR|nr:hypothetical protein L1987_00168 [Smallanthus sonchifolius]
MSSSMEFKTFLQPTRPSTYSNLTSISQHSESSVLQVSEPLTSTSNRQQPDGDEGKLFRELIKILFECLENVDNVTKGLLLRKVFLELEKESQMEHFIIEKLRRSHVKVITEYLERYLESSTCQIGEDEVKYDQQETVSRGFNEDLMGASRTGGFKAASSYKLERFKVKTITIEGGVIKK